MYNISTWNVVGYKCKVPSNEKTQVKYKHLEIAQKYSAQPSFIILKENREENT